MSITLWTFTNIKKEKKTSVIINDSTNNTTTNMTLSDLIKRVQDGNITYEYGKQLIIPYTDPVNNTEYELPFNFGTIQTFEKEDSTTFTGLGLVAEYGLPTGSIQFDASEPSNPDSNRKSYGNNNWSLSNLRQWMNKSGLNWYTAQHTYDAAPTTPNPTTVTGFLDCLPSDFVDAVVPVKNITKGSTSVENGALITTYDKFFPLSMSQCNMKCTNTAYGLNDETEGRYWEYWRNKTGADYLSGSGANNGGLAANNNRIVYAIENHSTAVAWWLRSAYLSNSNNEWNVNTSGNANNNNANNTGVRGAPDCIKI